MFFLPKVHCVTFLTGQSPTSTNPFSGYQSLRTGLMRQVDGEIPPDESKLLQTSDRLHASKIDNVGQTEQSAPNARLNAANTPEGDSVRLACVLAKFRMRRSAEITTELTGEQILGLWSTNSAASKFPTRKHCTSLSPEENDTHRHFASQNQ